WWRAIATAPDPAECAGSRLFPNWRVYKLCSGGGAWAFCAAHLGRKYWAKIQWEDSMKYLICAAALVVGPAIIALPPMLSAAENTPWAYPVAPKGAPKRDPAKIVTQPGSDKKYNEVEINNPYGP